MEKFVAVLVGLQVGDAADRLSCSHPHLGGASGHTDTEHKCHAEIDAPKLGREGLETY